MSTDRLDSGPTPGGEAGAAGSPTLGDLCARAGSGDHGAFEQLHRRIGAGLRRLLLKRSGGREDLVDDLMQRTWASVWKALREGRYDPSRAAITTFVYAVANNAWLTHLRGFAREQGYTGGPATIATGAVEDAAGGGAPPAEETLGEAELLDAVRACLREDNPAGLSGHERAILIGTAAGETDRGLAKRLGLSSSTVNIRKHAGYAKIRAYLGSRGLVAEGPAGVATDEPRRRAAPAGGEPGEIGGTTYARALTAHCGGAHP